MIETTPSDSFVSVLFYGDNYGIKESGRYRGGTSMSFNNIAHQGDSLMLTCKEVMKHKLTMV